MSRRERNDCLAALLSEAGWSTAEFARTVNTLGARQGLALRYDRSSIAHWLSGSQPRAAVANIAAQALSRRCHRLISAEETGLLAAASTRAPARLTPVEKADAVYLLHSLARSDADPHRRGAVTQTSYTLSAVALPDWDTPAPVQRMHSGPELRPADIETLKNMTHSLASLCDAYGGAHARTALATYLADDAAALAARTGPIELYRQVLVHCAELTHLLATMTTDAGYQGLAQQYYRVALALSLQARDRTRYAITLRAMSTQALRLGHSRHAIELARAAIESVGAQATSATRSFLLAQRAVTSAAQRDARHALADLAAAEREHSQATSHPGPFSHYPRAGLDYQRAQTLHALGDRGPALEALREAVRHRSPAKRRLYVLTQLRLADLLVDVGHLEEACAHCHLALDHYPPLHSARADRSLMQLAERLRSFPRQRQAAEALDRVRGLKRP